MKLKAMTFNTQHCLNYVTRQIDYPVMAEAIKTCAPDIVVLNEMRGKGVADGYDAQVDILAKMTDMQGYFAEAIRFDGKNPYGNALLSRFPITAAETVAIPDPAVRGYDGYYETRCLLKATVAVGGGLSVLVSHFGLNPDEQKSAVDTVVGHIPNTRCVFMGDLNVTPDNAVLRPIQQRLYDTAKVFSAPKLSFPSDSPTMKIDYIFVSNDLRVSAADIPAIVSSDHRPHIATVTVP